VHFWVDREILQKNFTGNIMPYRQRLRRERLEIYLVHLLLAYRRLILIVGLLLLVYTVVVLFLNPLVGFITLLPAMYLLMLSNSYNVVLYTARLVAWIATLKRNDD
jgi:hypothetical protein